MEKQIKSFTALIEAFGGPGAFAAQIGISDGLARVMKKRNRINPRHWSRIIQAAKNANISVSEADLTQLYAPIELAACD